MPDDFKNKAILEALSGLKNPQALDLGCGRGDYSSFLRARGVSVCSVDIEKKIGGAPKDFAVADAVNLPFAGKTFDLIIAFDVFEHIPKIDVAFSEATRVLKDDGVILASVPNDSTITRLYFTLTLRNPPSRSDKTHVRFLNYCKWRNLFSKNFRVIRVFGQLFTQDGSAFKRLGNALVSWLYYFTPNVYFLLGK